MNTVTYQLQPRISVTPHDHVQGVDNAPITLIEYGDYQCLDCERIYPLIKHVQARMGSLCRFVYRHFPTSYMHPYSAHAAEAAEAAADQGKFWEMHDLLYQNQYALDDRHLRSYAADLGLNVEQFTRDIMTNAHLLRIMDDYLSGLYNGVTMTPTIFINGTKYIGPWELEALIEAFKENVAAPKPADDYARPMPIR